MLSSKKEGNKQAHDLIVGVSLSIHRFIARLFVDHVNEDLKDIGVVFAALRIGPAQSSKV